MAATMTTVTAKHPGRFLEMATRHATRTVTRRRFLQHAAGAVGGLLILPSARTAFAYRANERLRLAVVGMAGYGAYHGFAEAIHTYGNVGYAVSCDVDLRKVQKVYDFWDAAGGGMGQVGQAGAAHGGGRVLRSAGRQEAAAVRRLPPHVRRGGRPVRRRRGRHAGSHACDHRGGGVAGRQAGVRREAADHQRPRGAGAAPAGPTVQAAHADEQPRRRQPGLPPRRGDHPRRRPRRRAASPRVLQPRRAEFHSRPRKAPRKCPRN